MGHLAGKEQILRQLQRRLHQNPVGLPEHVSISEILSILFTEREAKLGLKFPLGLITFEGLLKTMGMDKDELEGILNGMMKKGLVMTSKNDGQTRYLLSPGLTGFVEFTFMQTNESLPMK